MKIFEREEIEKNGREMIRFKKRIVQKFCEMEEQAVIKLIRAAGFNPYAFNIKEKEGAYSAIDALKQEGYVITQIGLNNGIETRYILQQYGKEIAQIDVSLTVKGEK